MMHSLLIFFYALMGIFTPGSSVSPQSVAEHGTDAFFTVSEIPDDIFLQMQGKTYPTHCTTPRSDLRYITCLHHDGKGRVLVGEMVLHKSIAHDVCHIFRQLYDARYPIESMRLPDLWNADDEQQMRANNSSGFCFRYVSHTTTVSKHGRGLAVDINPLYNPYVRHHRGKTLVEPSTARSYVNRSRPFPYKIVKGDMLHRLFLAKGFHWGGSWQHNQDYQHFEK